MRKRSRQDRLGQLQSLAAGIEQDVSLAPLVIGGVEYDRAALIARLQTSIDAETAVDQKRSELNQALAECRSLRKNEASFLYALRSLTLIIHGHSPVALSRYGLAPHKENPKRTGEQRVLMQAKNLATRKKRGTLGAKKKRAIKGNVAGVVITPVRGREDDE